MTEENPAADGRDPFRDWDAAYVLGSLSPEDRRAFERHLPTCPACSAAVAELAGMPGLLATLSTDDALALLAEPEAEAPRDEQYQSGQVRLLATAAARSRRRSRRGFVAIAVAAAAALLFGGIALGNNLDRPGAVVADPPVATGGTTTAHPISMTPLRPGTMTADLELASKSWGTRLDWSCEYLGTGWQGAGAAPSYDLVVTDASGKETIVASWTAAGAKATGLSASSSVQTSDIRSIDIRISGSKSPIVETTL